MCVYEPLLLDISFLQLSKSVGMKGNDRVEVIQDLDLPFPDITDCLNL